MALPIATPEFGYTEHLVGDKKVRIQTMNTAPTALFQKDEDGIFVDSDGTEWLTGWVNGVHVRRKFYFI
jgi:hypothetical protein